MTFYGQLIVPSIRNLIQLEEFLHSPYRVGVLLDVHIGQLRIMMDKLKKHNKKILIHADLIQGLKNDDFSTEFLCQEFKPFGIISTRTNVICKAKQKGVIAIFRVFLLDSHALEKFYSLLHKIEPDYIEVLPGTMPPILKEISTKVPIPILTGGFIRTTEDVESALSAGAIAVTTSMVELWGSYSDILNRKIN